MTDQSPVYKGTANSLWHHPHEVKKADWFGSVRRFNLGVVEKTLATDQDIWIITVNLAQTILNTTEEVSKQTGAL